MNMPDIPDFPPPEFFGDGAADGDGAGAPGARPGTADAVRATVGVFVVFGAGLLIAGVVMAIASNPAVGETRSAGAERAQLAVQAVVFALGALLLIEGLRLGHRPRSRDALTSPAVEPDRAPGVSVIAVGLVAAAAALVVGAAVSWILPGLSDPGTTTLDGLGVGTGYASDFGTAVVVAGLVPLGEELLFRGALAGAWLRAGRPAIAVASSALLFGLAHVTVGPRTMFVAAILGAIFALALLVSRSLAAPVLAHATLNAVALIDAGLTTTPGLILLAVVVVLSTLLAWRLTPLVSWLPPRDAPAGTLRP